MHAFEKHRREAPAHLNVAILTVSSSRFREASRGHKVSDASGDLAARLLKRAGHVVTAKRIVDDDSSMIRSELLRLLYEDKADAAVLIGGTGLSGKDVTIETVQPLLDKTIEGFGELFRAVSYDRIGSPALLTRALAGTIDGRLVLCLPGATDAVATGLKLALKELPHAAYIARA